MGMEEVAQTTPKQITLKQLSAKRAERRQEDMAKRVVETRKRLESRNPTLLQSLPSEPPTSSYRMQLNASSLSPRAWRWSSLLRKTSQMTRRNSGTKSKRRPMRLKELHRSWYNPLPNVDAQRRLHRKPLIWNLQILPKAHRRHRRVGMWIFPTSRLSLHNRTEKPPWPERRHQDLMWTKSVSTQRKRKQFLLVHYFSANSFSQKHSGPHGIRFARPCRDTPAQLGS